MKKIYLLLFVSMIALNSAFSAVHIFDVGSSNFTPFSLSATVGDTVRWVWTGGTHNTVSGSIPSGATPWNNPISAASPQFDYVVAVEGVYLFACTIHSFYGQFSVSAATGIETTNARINFLVSSEDLSNYRFSYHLSGNSAVELTLTDITGKTVRTLFSGEKAGGQSIENYYFGDLRSGIYFALLLCEGNRIFKRIVID